MLFFWFQADIIDIIINLKYGNKTIPLTVNGNNTFAEVKEMLAAMEDIEASSLTNITFQGRRYADDDKLKDIMNKISGSQALDFYTHLKLRGGGVIKKIGKKDRERQFQHRKRSFWTS